MKYARTERFKKAYAKLPPDIQDKVVKAFQLFKENPRHPSLGVKRVQGMPNVCLFRNIGPHAIIEREP